MAGEYSRELSVKVFAGQCRLIELGFRQGGAAGFGLRRVLVNERGEIKGELKRGEHKSLQTDRVILMPDPDEEVAWVNKMYRWLIEEDLSLREIADRLNEEGVTTDLDRPRTSGTVRTVLTNEKYICNNFYNRSSFKLKKLPVENPPDMWVRKEGTFEGIVPLEFFLTAQEIITARSARLSDEELLDHLKRPRLCENSVRHGRPRNDVLPKGPRQYFVLERIAEYGAMRKLFQPDSRNWSFHTASALCRRWPAFWGVDRSNAGYALVIGLSQPVRIAGMGL